VRGDLKTIDTADLKRMRYAITTLPPASWVTNWPLYLNRIMWGGAVE